MKQTDEKKDKEKSEAAVDKKSEEAENISLRNVNLKVGIIFLFKIIRC